MICVNAEIYQNSIAKSFIFTIFAIQKKISMEENNVQVFHETLYQYLREQYPDLRFKTRLMNNFGRLDAGFWFVGDNNYLGTSCWDSADWQNKTPSIFFGIDMKDKNNPKAFLNLVAYTNEDKARFFEKIAAPLRLNRVKRAGIPSNMWGKIYEGDFLTGINEFIETDKTIIDAFIISQKVTHLFPEIKEDIFNKQIKRVEKLREQLKKKQLPTKPISKNGVSKLPLKLETLTLKNIGSFQKAEVDFKKQITCFIGQNGCGKTTILRGILLGLIGIDQNPFIRDDERLARSFENLLRLNGEQKGEMNYEDNGFIKLKTNQQKGTTGVEFQLNEQGRPQPQDGGDFAPHIDELGNLNTLVIAFPQVQGVRDSKLKDTDSLRPNVSDLLPLLADVSDGRGKIVSKWITQLDHAAANQEKKGEASVERQILNRLFEIVSDVTEQTVKFESINPQKEIIWINIDGQIVPLSLISQGFNNVFSWIGYFMQRLRTTNPQLNDPTQASAICFIDEIDTYLHPRWQRTIMPAFAKHFPNTQFIITTHSPLVIGNLTTSIAAIYRIDKLNDGESEVYEENSLNFYGADTERLLYLFMDTAKRPKEVEVRFKTYFNAIDKNDFSKATQIGDELKNLIDARDPEILRGESMMKTLKMLQTI
jgi:predicted ATP-binding protein involved in virulence